MAHARQQIRDALALLLIGLPQTGSRVFTSRNIVLQDAELPAIEINTNQEAVQLQDIHGGILERDLTIDIIVKTKVVTQLDDRLDDIIADIEAKINANQTNRTLNGLCQGLDLTELDIGIDESLATPVGQAVLRYKVQYHTPASNPQTIL